MRPSTKNSGNCVSALAASQLISLGFQPGEHQWANYSSAPPRTATRAAVGTLTIGTVRLIPAAHEPSHWLAWPPAGDGGDNEACPKSASRGSLASSMALTQ
jgi:hypothetical protein